GIAAAAAARVLEGEQVRMEQAQEIVPLPAARVGLTVGRLAFEQALDGSADIAQPPLQLAARDAAVIKRVFLFLEGGVLDDDRLMGLIAGLGGGVPLPGDAGEAEDDAGADADDECGRGGPAPRRLPDALGELNRPRLDRRPFPEAIK